MKLKIILITFPFILLGCANQKHQARLGPVDLCTTPKTDSFYKKNKMRLDQWSNCFDEPVAVLKKKGLIIDKARWLESKYGVDASIAFLEGAFSQSEISEHVELINQLINLSLKKEDWKKLYFYSEMAIDSRGKYYNLVAKKKLGLNLTEQEYEKLPHILKSPANSIRRASVNRVNDTLFSLKKVNSDSTENVFNGEPSLIVDSSGENMVLSWMYADGVATEVGTVPFHLRTYLSEDGGDTWSQFNSTPLFDQPDTQYFDPLGVWDEARNSIYFGGLMLDYTLFIPPRSSWGGEFFYDWDLENNTISGPYLPDDIYSFKDKGELAVDAAGQIWMAHHHGVHKSNEIGQPFQSVSDEFIRYFPIPSFDLNNCLYVISSEELKKCKNGDNSALETVRDIPYSSLDLINMYDYLPGTFRAVPITILQFSANNDLYVVYPDLISENDDDIGIWMTSSSDGGSSWSEPWLVTPDIPGDRFLPWFIIDDEQRMHLMYADTRNVAQQDQGESAWFDMYYSYSDDLGQSWNESRVTPNAFEVLSWEWNDYNISDYLSMQLINNEPILAFPWSRSSQRMDMFIARKVSDLIFLDGFESF